MIPYRERQWHKEYKPTRFTLAKCPECGSLNALDDGEIRYSKCVVCGDTYLTHVYYLKLMNNEVE